MVKALFIALIPAFFAALPLFQPGFIPTHDGEFHIIRFWQFEKMLQAGHLFPRWAPDLNSGYGVPVFNFNYPLPNYFGTLFHSFGFSYADSFKLTMAGGYLLAVFFSFFWLKKLFGQSAAVVGTIIFSYIPYWFVEIYVRGSVGEVLALGWVMAALASVEYGWKRVFALSIAAIVVSHNILATAFLPLLFIYAFIRKKLWVYTWLTVGVAVAAYFWLPALSEQKFVVGLNTVDFKDYFVNIDQLIIPSWGTGFAGSGLMGNQMSVQGGLVPLVVLILSVFFTKKEKNLALRKLGLFFLGGSIISIFLTLRLSQPIWETVTILPFWQYPWRWLAMLLPSIAFLSARFPIFLAIAAIIMAYPYSRPVVYPSRDDAYYLSRSNFTDGTSSPGNSFSTVWLPWQASRPKQKIEFFNQKTETKVRINTSYYPGWVVYVDGKQHEIDYHDGLINLRLPPGPHNISASFTETPLRKTADVISLASLLWLVGSAILKRYAYRYRRYTA